MNTISSQIPLPKGAEVDPGMAVSKPQDQHRSEPARETDRNEEARSPSFSEVENLVSEIQNRLTSLNINVSFSTYGGEGERTAVVVTERDTGDLIREFPPEELQNLYTKMDELVGMIFSNEA